MKNLKFVEVDTSLLWKCYKSIDEHELNPRDSIHLACVLEVEEKKIISEDQDFDEVEEIKREWIV